MDTFDDLISNPSLSESCLIKAVIDPFSSILIPEPPADAIDPPLFKIILLSLTCRSVVCI